SRGGTPCAVPRVGFRSPSPRTGRAPFSAPGSPESGGLLAQLTTHGTVPASCLLVVQVAEGDQVGCVVPAPRGFGLDVVDILRIRTTDDAPARRPRPRRVPRRGPVVAVPMVPRPRWRVWGHRVRRADRLTREE